MNILTKRLVTAIAAISSSVVFASAASAGSSTGIGAMAGQLQKQFSAIMTMVTGGATLVGSIIFIVGIMKIKAWKDNPQQNPLGTGITLCVVGVLLVYLPSFLGMAGGSLFSSGTTAGISGTTDLLAP